MPPHNTLYVSIIYQIVSIVNRLLYKLKLITLHSEYFYNNICYDHQQPYQAHTENLKYVSS